MTCETCSHFKVCALKNLYKIYEDQYKPDSNFDTDNFDIQINCKNYNDLKPKQMIEEKL